MSYHVGFIGLGAMGMGSATSCIEKGLNVYGVDLQDSALEKLKLAGANAVSKDCAEFAHQLDALVFFVVNAAQVLAIFETAGLVKKLKPGTVVMVCSTISVEDAKRIEQLCLAHDLLMLDSPVSGGAAKAAKGLLSVMAAGAPSAFEKAQPVLDAIAEKVYRAGDDIGKGSLVKIIHQLLAGVHIAAGAEAMALAARAGISLDLMYDVVTHSAGNSWMFENRMKHVVDGDYTPLSMVDIFVKDLGLVNGVAQALKFPTPLASTAYNMFASASNDGYGKEDDSAVIKSFKGIQLPSKKEQ